MTAQDDRAPSTPTTELSEPVVRAGSADGPDAELTTVGQDTESGTSEVGRTDDTVPTLDDVRSKIEGRFARAGGQAELDAASAEGRHRQQTEESRAQAAKEALDKIRASLHQE